MQSLVVCVQYNASLARNLGETDYFSIITTALFKDIVHSVHLDTKRDTAD